MEYSCFSFTGLVIRFRDSLIHCLIDLVVRWWWCSGDGGGAVVLMVVVGV
ncbi:hypothetical protein Hdeb2414_s0013g00406751 [Helianthus debilis subsp. tardiflorus]